ncbi:MAG: Si-specific NAD(P)(+) transhydrogenase, partial [Rhodospirillales bacterium]|nr:Si-specific NAD(P)(+) transhydrogenase [Rhodospirillales bacterium]
LSGYHERSIYGASYTVKQNITITDLLFRAEHVIKHEIDIARHQLQRNWIEVFPARASFVDPHTVRLANVIGDGTATTRDPSVTFDGQRIFTSDDILTLNALPRSLVVIGAGVIGIEYATMFAALGVRVTVVDKRTRLLPFVDAEIIDALVHSIRQNRVTLRPGEEVAGLEIFADQMGERVRVSLKSGKHIVAERALYSIGRGGAVDGLNLAAAGITPEGRGKIKVNRDYQTDVPHIYAVGDVVGFPSLASTSMEQARIATCHAFSTPAPACRICSPMASTRSRKSPWSERPRKN